MQLQDIRNKKVLISPLNWGFGHVSRSIGMIHRCLELENEVVVACDAEQEAIFKMYFPELIYVSHEGYPFKFGGKGRFASDLLFRYSALRKRLKQEMVEVENLVNQYQIDVVLSDHRYGFRAKSVPSIFITHQLNLPLKWFQAPIAVQHNKWIRKFSDVWVLDTPESDFAGMLSASLEGSRVVYLGPVSRFERYEVPSEKTQEHVVIVSGPSIYAQQFADWAVEKYPNATFVCDSKIQLPAAIKRLSNSWKEQDAAILEAKHIVSRSGYSTIMDVAHLGIEATYVPTPGQAEQIYLKKWLTDCSEYSS